MDEKAAGEDSRRLIVFTDLWSLSCRQMTPTEGQSWMRDGAPTASPVF
jgi:hypothetical protein